MENKEFPVKYCLDCETVYEMDKKNGIIQCPDFPTYGLQRETCCSCDNKK